MIPQRNTNQTALCARTAHRLHLLHRWRRGRIHRCGRSAHCLSPVHLAPHRRVRTPNRHNGACLWLLRAQHLPLPFVHQRWHGAGAHSRHWHSSPLLLLWRFLTVGLHSAAVHPAPYGCRAKPEAKIGDITTNETIENKIL